MCLSNCTCKQQKVAIKTTGAAINSVLVSINYGRLEAPLRFSLVILLLNIMQSILRKSNINRNVYYPCEMVEYNGLPADWTAS